MTTTEFLITKADRRRLGELLTTPAGRAWGTLRTIGELETLLEDAPAVACREAPESLITMNSSARIVDLATGAERVVTLVYPEEADDSANAVSVTSPLGVALLGCRVGDVVQYASGSQVREFLVKKLIFQPERAATLSPQRHGFFVGN